MKKTFRNLTFIALIGCSIIGISSCENKKHDDDSKSISSTSYNSMLDSLKIYKDSIQALNNMALSDSSSKIRAQAIANKATVVLQRLKVVKDSLSDDQEAQYEELYKNFNAGALNE